MTNRKPRRPDVSTLDLVGGPERLEVELHEYDEQWPDRFLEHRRRILEALEALEAVEALEALEASGASVEIEHIGSTSVPGLAAKPIIDILVVVDDITAEEDHLDPLLAAGYELRVREPGHRLVRTPARDVHVHLFERDDPAVAEYLLFRDHLRSDAEDRALYERTKRALISRAWDDMNDYADAKTDVIVAIKARARARARARVRAGGRPADRDAPALVEYHSGMTNPAPIEDVPIEDVSIGGEEIRLGQFLKFAGLLDSGGNVKEAIIDGEVAVNGEVDRRRGRQLHLGDVVSFDGRSVRVCP